MNQAAKFFSFPTQSEILKPFVAYYYFHFSEAQDNHISFDFFPHYEHAITVYKGSSILAENTTSTVKALSSSQQITTPLYCTNIHNKVGVSISGPFNKIGIVFHPLGIHHFMDTQELITGNSLFHHLILNDYSDFELTLESVYEETDFNNKIMLLDSYFLSIIRDFKQPLLQNAVQLILRSNGSKRVDEIAETLSTNRKQLLRLFKKYLFCSVEEYKKMVMFRKALIYCKTSEEEINLTDVALFSMYYDQAHFIKHFKSITSHTPKSLLEKLQPIGSQNTIWNFNK